MTRFFKKSKKPYFGVILGSFCQNLGKKSFSEKKALSILKYFNYLLWGKKSEKSNNPFLIKIPNCWTDRQTEDSGFIGPSVAQGSKKSNLEQKSATLFEREK